MAVAKAKTKRRMADWGPVLVAVILFILLSPGLLFQVHGADKFIQFGNFETSATSIFLHSLIFFALFCLFTLVLHLHIYV
ncbi:uncharacterized protein LOC111470766 [Cucurbita maxima]|uniref:Uncharacterized protein LOC111470766 n=2 Tax=Cucurbita TaxID=3660 RepID=A0A6J1IAL9_CUCMA|nr:uncharacterized protein LOC111470766 [Cucurbita maxima]